ncbi:hypothetical protein ROZALSC1DRAFT_26870 [Rozella allomycis CSF55]|uniref:Small ribosomal subunit protein eS1 n=1 Tax=Rozella allomycis (strain CSF55) TaxID=988480 RepID=A0A4P9YQ88_ROZAC|nr:hypothetical protein ROZALSC1DRAFT_26870 [Rozella allomycis CSF55]
MKNCPSCTNEVTAICGSCLSFELDPQTKDKLDDLKEFQLHLFFPLGVHVREHSTRLAKNIQDFSLKDIVREKIQANIDSQIIQTSRKIVEIHFTYDGEVDDILPFSKGKKKFYKKDLNTVLESITDDRFSEYVDCLRYIRYFSVPPIPPLSKLKIRSFQYSCLPLYIAGRYNKYSRDVCQSPWTIKGKEKGIDNVEDIIGRVCKKYTECSAYSLNASGREDIDVRMLGQGRPFIIELKNPKFIALPEGLNKIIEEEINAGELVKVNSLVEVDGISASKEMRVGEEEKSKLYRCLVHSESNLDQALVERVNSMSNIVLNQRTPLRVLHRRAVCTRERTIYEMKAQLINSHFLILNLRAQAGTYIKEFIHSDIGRTNPSFGTLLGPDYKCDILELDVLDAIGKNKRLSKGKKGLKKKNRLIFSVDPFTRKDWYDIKAPSFFSQRTVGKTVVNRTQGLKNADDSLKGRVLELSLGDLHKDVEEHAFRKFKLKVEEIQGKNCLTNFNGMEITSDKLRSMVKKWQSLIEAHVDVKTTDGYLLRLFAIGFTARRKNQVRKTCYAQASQIRAIRKKMFEIMTRETVNCELKEFVTKLIPDTIGKEIEKATQSIFPLQNVLIRKVKILKAPKYDASKLLELHAEGSSSGSKVARTGGFKEPVPQESV